MKTVCFTVLVAILALFWLGEGRIAGQCGTFCAPCEDSQVTYGPDACGNVQYELIVVMTDGPEHDEGPASSYGTCYEVRNCDGTGYSGVQDGTEELTDLNDESNYDYEADDFYWTLDDWTVTYSAKSCANGYQGATNYTRMRNPLRDADLHGNVLLVQRTNSSL